jgi:hypothetical protein
MKQDQELISFIDTAEGKQRLALCLVSRGLRNEEKKFIEGVTVGSAFSRQTRESEDITFLKHNYKSIESIIQFIKDQPRNVPEIEYSGFSSDFKNQYKNYKHLKDAANQAETLPTPVVVFTSPPPRLSAVGGVEGGAPEGAVSWCFTDQEILKQKIDGASYEVKKVLIAFSKKLRINLGDVDIGSLDATIALFKFQNADIEYLLEKRDRNIGPDPSQNIF